MPHVIIIVRHYFRIHSVVLCLWFYNLFKNVVMNVDVTLMFSSEGKWNNV